MSDKLKSCLTAGTLNYVLSLGGNDWFDPSKTASLADTYAANHDPRFGSNQSHPQKQSNVAQGNATVRRPPGSSRPQYNQSQKSQAQYHQWNSRPNNFGRGRGFIGYNRRRSGVLNVMVRGT